MRTRTEKQAASKTKSNVDVSEPTATVLGPSIQNPPKLFVLPKRTSPHARIITIGKQGATTEVPNRYLACPDKGFHEFTKVAAPKRACRSWLLAPEERTGGDAKTQSDISDANELQTEQTTSQEGSGNDNGYILSNSDMFVATPVDPLFVMLSCEGILWHAETSKATEYLALSDYVRTLKMWAPHLRQVVEDNPGSKLEGLLELRTKAICTELSMGDEEAMYAVSLDKLAQLLLHKASQMVQAGLPTSLEEHFVKQALEAPVLSIRREESSISIIAEDATLDAGSEIPSASTSQDTDASETTVESMSTTATSTTSTATPEIADVTHLLRIRTALNYLLASYIPGTLRSRLEVIFTSSTSSSINFTPLDKHLTHIASLKSQAQALRSISDNVSRKRGLMDDDEALEKADAKKRKKEDEDAKKNNVSHGVKKLMKANTSGMQKLSSFFTKGVVAKKS